MICLFFARFQARISHKFYHKIKQTSAPPNPQVQTKRSPSGRRRKYCGRDGRMWLMNFLPQICRGMMPHVRLTPHYGPHSRLTSHFMLSTPTKTHALPSFSTTQKLASPSPRPDSFVGAFVCGIRRAVGCTVLANRHHCLQNSHCFNFFVHVVQSILTYPLMRAYNPRRRGLVL
jgi:hypothetical protein